jgi:hypothetical protein
MRACHRLLLVVCLLFSICGCDRKIQPEERPPVSINDGPKSPRNASLPSTIARSHIDVVAKEDDWFRGDATEIGVRFNYSDGSASGLYQLIESVGGGVGIFDLDRDSLPDLVFTGGGHLQESQGSVLVSGSPLAAFRNISETSFYDVSAVTGLSSVNETFTHGCTVLDFNSDGFDDLVVSGFHDVQLWQNFGDGTFIEMADAAELRSPHWNASVAAGDINNDGLADLYILTYSQWKPDVTCACLNDQGLRDICGPTLFEGERDQVFQNTGDGFLNVTDQVGLVPQNRGLGIVVCDFDQDGHLDTSVVNDVEANQLYFGSKDGAFEEAGVISGVAYSITGEREGSMGVDVGDFDRDGLPDLWYTNYAQQDNSLLRNVSDRGFVHSAGVTGLTGVSRNWVGFGTAFADFDGDGWEDLFISNGHVAYERLDSPYRQPPQLFRNESGQAFTDASVQGGPYFQQPWSGRGATTVDWNNDGALDLVVVHQNEPAEILTNRNELQSWISVKLIGTTSERTAVGASASITVAGKTMRRWNCGGGNYLSHRDTRLFFSLTNDATVDIQVTWLGGATETFSALIAKSHHTLIQGRGRPVGP